MATFPDPAVAAALLALLLAMRRWRTKRSTLSSRSWSLALLTAWAGTLCDCGSLLRRLTRRLTLASQTRQPRPARAIRMRLRPALMTIVIAI